MFFLFFFHLDTEDSKHAILCVFKTTTRMEVIMLYGFISDSAFVGIDTSNEVPYEELGTGLGLVTDQMVNYFMDPTYIKDPRSAKMIGSTNQRLTVSPFTSKLDGKVLLHFDKLHFTENITNLTGSKPNLTKFFNCIERIYLSQSEGATTLDNALKSDTDTYGNYVEGTLQMSSARISTPVKYISGGDAEGIYRPTPLPSIVTWIQFGYEVPDGPTITLKLWLDGTAFMEDYEYSNIVKVIYPCAPEQIISMGFDSKTAAIIASANYKDAELAYAIKHEDHSGLETFTSKYTNNSVAGWFRLPFTLLYKGRVPSFTQMRNAIRTDLLDREIATIDIWKNVLPDLFADAAFFMVPMYQNVLTLPEGTIDQNIINYKNIISRVKALYPQIPQATLENYGELLQAPAAGLYIFTFPSIENDEEFRSIKAIHPTYQDIDAINNSGNDDFESMDELTQDFNETLSICMAVCLGRYRGPNPLTESSEDHKNYISFVSNYVEFHMLTQDSYY